MNSLLDDLDIDMWRSPSGLRHVGSWFSETQCGAFVNPSRGWRWDCLTSLRYVGRISRRPQANRMCKRCANGYKDVED